MMFTRVVTVSKRNGKFEGLKNCKGWSGRGVAARTRGNSYQLSSTVLVPHVLRTFILMYHFFPKRLHPRLISYHPLTSTTTTGTRFDEVIQVDVGFFFFLFRSNACPVKEEVVAPFWANNTRGEVLALLNLYPFEQYVHWERCT